MKGWIYLQLSGTSALRPDIQGLIIYEYLHRGKTRGVYFFCSPPPPGDKNMGFWVVWEKHDNLSRKKGNNKGKREQKTGNKRKFPLYTGKNIILEKGPGAKKSFIFL